MPRNNIPPTRTNLIQMRNELQFAREGYEILDQKREVLAKELVRLANDAETLQEQMDELITAAYRALRLAKLTMGREHVEWASLAVNKTVDVELKYRGVMGVTLPLIEASGAPPELSYSPGDTTATLDEASALFRDVVQKIPDLSRLETSVWRLAVELRKTQRRVNALQYIFIPDYVETINFIQSSLEEREREEVFRLKLLKHRAGIQDEPEPEPALSNSGDH